METETGHVAGRHARPMVIAKLTAPFDRYDIRFKKGGGGMWYPYFDADAITARLNNATDYSWDLVMQPWEWRATYVAVYGHLQIPGLGKRAGIGVQEHTSNAGNEMGADMIKGLRADLLKNCAIAFGCGDQFRSMDAIPFDPDDERNKERLTRYLDFYFPNQTERAKPETEQEPSLPKGKGQEPEPEPAAHECADCQAPLTVGQRAISMKNFGLPLCPKDQQARKAAA